MSPSNDTFSAVVDSALAIAIRRAVEDNVRRPLANVFEVLAQPGRNAVPAISTAHFTREDEARIAQAFQDTGQQIVYAVALEPLKNIPAVIRVSTTQEGLHEFQRRCSHFNYVLSTADARAMVVCTTDDYLVYLGDRTFVESCAGTTEAAALRFFLGYADSPAWPHRARQALVSVYTVLAEVFPLAPKGTFVQFPTSLGAT